MTHPPAWQVDAFAKAIGIEVSKDPKLAKLKDSKGKTAMKSAVPDYKNVSTTIFCFLLCIWFGHGWIFRLSHWCAFIYEHR